MKKAKKILSLMLVVAMALSMMVFTGGTASAANIADYTDLGNIEYKEAAELLIALGIMIGYDETTFGPERELTREVAATVIARILLGSEVADRLASQNTGFDDVDVERWSSKYIAYCVNVGIINGYGDGNFGPEDPVTASQLAKMLLIALGYGKNGEFSDPNTWEFNAIVKGQEYNILPSFVSADFTKPATREQVALYTFQTIIQPTVTYYEVFKTYSTQTNPMDSNSAVNQSLARRVFGVTVDNTVTDSNGFPARVWMRNNIALTAAYATGAVLQTYTNGGQNPTTFATNGFEEFMRGNTAGNGASAKFSYDVDETGVAYNETTIPVFVNGARDASGNNVNAIAFSQIPGNTVQYVDADYDNLVDKIIITQKWAYTVNTAPVTASGKVSISASVINAAVPNGTPIALTGVDATLIEYPADLAAGDVILVHTRLIDATTNTRAIVVEKAKTAIGTLTSFSAFGVTFGGAFYTGSALGPAGILNTITDDTTNFGVESTIWLDDNNAIIAFKPGETTVTTSYGLLVGYEYNALSLATGATAKAAVYGTDGIYKVYNVAAGVGGIVPDQRGVTVNSIVTYSLNDNNEITFSAAAGTASETAVTYTPGTATMDLTAGSGFLTANTVFFYYELSAQEIAQFAVKTGYANALKIDGKDIDYVIANGVVLAVFVKAAPPAAFGNYAYVTVGAPISTEIVYGVPVYSYTAYVNGESTIIKSYDNTLFTAPGLYGYFVMEGGYAVGPTNNDLNLEAGDTITRVEPSYVAHGNTVKITDSNTKFYLVQTDASGATTVFESPIANGNVHSSYKFLAAQPGAPGVAAVAAIYYTIDLNS